MKKKFYLFSILSMSGVLFASLEGNLSSKADLTLITKSKEGSLEFDKAQYDINLVNLNINDKDYGFNFGTNIKSSRKNLLADDFSVEQYNKQNDKKSLNHDLQAKIFVNWKYPKEGIVTPNVEFAYFLDNYFRKTVTDKGKVTEEENSDFEFIDDKKKYLGGDVLLNVGLSSKPLDKLVIDNKIDYYANSLIKYNKGFPNLKILNKVKYDISDKSNFNFLHEFNLNLRSFAVPYVEEKENEDDEHYAYLDNFVRRYRQKFESSYKNNDYEVNVNLKDNGYYIASGKDISDPLSIENHRVNFDIKGKSKHEISGVKITNDVALENKFETIYYVNTQNYELWSLVKPTHTLGLSKEFNVVDNLKLTPVVNFETKVILPTTKNIFDKENIVHSYKPTVKLNVSYDKDSIKSSANFAQNIDFSILGTKFGKVGLEYNYDGESTYKYDDKLNFKLTGKGNLKVKFLKDEYQRIFTDSVNFDNKIEGGLEYKIVDGKDYKLSVKSNLGVRYENEYGYILDSGNVPFIPPKDLSENGVSKELRENLKDLNPRRRNYKNKANLLLQIQEYSLNSELEYNKKIDKLSIGANLKVEGKIDLISLVKEKQSKLEPSAEDKEEKRVALKTSEYNMGGKILINPSTNLKYEITESLSLNTKLELPIEFSKNVLNKINDKKRTDNGTYGPADAKFNIRKITPKVGLELQYKW